MNPMNFLQVHGMWKCYVGSKQRLYQMKHTQKTYYVQLPETANIHLVQKMFGLAVRLIFGMLKDPRKGSFRLT